MNRLVDRMLAGDPLALSRLMTVLENEGVRVPEVMARLYSRLGRAARVGITGPPGAGKSTLADHLISLFRQEGKTVGVVAVDPSSPFSGGAILGDRVRMERHSRDEGVFIRSMGSRGTMGGISLAASTSVQLLDAFGMDVILIETVGVGQTEMDIMNVADTVVVVLVPESGDAIQTMKAGLLEIADVFVVNKADRPGADRLAQELRFLSEMNRRDKGWEIPVLLCAALTGQGVQEVREAIARHREWSASQAIDSEREGESAIRELHRGLMTRLEGEVREALRNKGDYPRLLEAVRRRQVNPYEAYLQIAAAWPKFIRSL